MNGSSHIPNDAGQQTASVSASKTASVPNQPESTPVPKRHWASMRLVYALLAMTAACLILGYYVAPVLRQRSIIQQIQQLGGKVGLAENYTYPDRGLDSGVVRRLLGRNAIDTAINVRVIGLESDSNSILKSIAALSKVNSISFRESNVDDSTIKAISNLKDLETLDLRFTSITDATLNYLYQHPSLRHLDLCGTAVSKKAAEKFAADNPDVVVQHTVGLRVVFFDQSKTEVTPPLLTNKKYSLQIFWDVPEGCHIWPHLRNRSSIWLSYSKKDGTLIQLMAGNDGVNQLPSSIAVNSFNQSEKLIGTSAFNWVGTLTNHFSIDMPRDVELTLIQAPLYGKTTKLLERDIKFVDPPSQKD